MNKNLYKRTFVLNRLTLLGSILFTFLVIEILLRILSPVESLYPRWKYSSKYGHVLFANTVMIHEKPVEWSYTYSINEYGYRGDPIPISNVYEKRSTIILGDSNAFGTGVNDEEVFSSVMSRQLRDDYNIINLSVGAYGLTQQIRRYYEFGQLYQPAIVILQFYSNDPEDNFYNKVTEVQNGRFIFKEINHPGKFLKKILSNSLIQKSQLYNRIRQSIHMILKNKYLEGLNNKTSKITSKTPNNIKKIREEFYNSLLELFAKDLYSKNIRLIFFSVYDESLEMFPLIRQQIRKLDSIGYLEYININSWFENREEYPRSPEGHALGKEAHSRLGYKLSRYIQDQK